MKPLPGQGPIGPYDGDLWEPREVVHICCGYRGEWWFILFTNETRAEAAVAIRELPLPVSLRARLLNTLAEMT